MWRYRIFCSPKHWKWTKGNTKKWTELTIPLIFRLGTIVRLQVCSYLPGKMKHSIFHKSYHDNKFANTETLINIVWLVIEQWPEICFQVFNMPKMNLVELSTQISIPDDSIKILIRHVCSMYHRSNHHCKVLNLAEFTHYITKSITQTPKNFNLYCLVSPNERCLEIAFSNHQKSEDDDTETIMENRWILLKFRLGMFLHLHICFNHHSKMTQWVCHTLHQN